MLTYEGTQAEMAQSGTWMEMITESNILWERVVQYGQFQPINKQETEQERRKRRSNTFAMRNGDYPRKITPRVQKKELEWG